MEKALNLEKVVKDYYRMIPYYIRLGENLKEALEFFTNEKGISVSSIDYRVKNLDSFLKKIKRKKYSDPFRQINDLCGVRIVCFFYCDIKLIENILRNEFEIVSKTDKEEDTLPTQFGYRSKHLIIKIKDSWVKTPNYRGLKNLRAEIQIRTILMHAWAEIEHKLAYKKEEHIPDEFRRRFSLLSAKLEEADGQFEELAREIKERNENLRKKTMKAKVFNKNLDLNLDNLQLFLDFYFTNKIKNIGSTRDLLDDIIIEGLVIKDLVNYYEKNKDKIKALEEKTVRKEISQTESFRDSMKIKKNY